MAPLLLLFSSSQPDWWLNGGNPSLAMCGDSWAQGQGYENYGDEAEYSGNIQAQPAHWIKQTLGETFTYHVYAVGGTTYADATSTYVPDGVASGAKAILVIAGGNDIVAERTWGQVEADLDTIAAEIGVGQHLFIVDLPPARGFSDVIAAQCRDWGSDELPTWAAANDATLIPIRAGMAQIRPSTGELDDLHDDYHTPGDDNHPNVPTGTQALAALLLVGLNGYYT